MSSKEGLSLLAVMENLTAIVDAGTLEDLEISGNLLLVPEYDRDVDWTSAGVNEETLSVIRTTIQSANKYLHAFYKKMKEGEDNRQLMDGIRNIIVMVGEAKKKLEKFDRLFGEKISELPEYQEIQKFYSKRVITDISKDALRLPFPTPQEHIVVTEDEWDSVLDHWAKEEAVEEIGGVHYLNDLEVVKGDHLYELFYLKNETGHPFYTPELEKNIKLACDFGSFIQLEEAHDPLIQLKSWEDKSLQVVAKKIRVATRKESEKFYKQAFGFKDIPIVTQLHNALMALMLASNPRNLLRQNAKKGCGEYFTDFKHFLSEAISHRDYQKLFVHEGEAEESAFYHNLFILANSLCFHLYTQGPWKGEITKKIQEIAQASTKIDKSSIPRFLETSFYGIQEALKYHPSGPVFKAVDLIREEVVPHFEPVRLGNLPEIEGVLQLGDKNLQLLRIPSPTRQEQTKRAEITKEFKIFLYHVGNKKEGERVLIFNFQDRTSWKEHARALALEELSRKAEFAEILTVVTLAKETDFYNQAGYYHNLEGADDFKRQFLEHLQDENTGYYYPVGLKSELFSEFLPALLETLHEYFFQGEEALTLANRLDFIEMTYLLMELKILELTQPQYISHLSKDGLDLSGSGSAALVIVLLYLQGKKWDGEDAEGLLYLLYGPTLMQRERPLHRERFERLLSLSRCLESQDKKAFKALGALFKKGTLEMTPHFPKEKE